MHSEDDLQYAIDNTKVILSPERRIETFGTTSFHFYLVTELMDRANEIRVRDGTNGPRPPTYFDTLVLAWLAFASPCYYSAHQNRVENSLFFLGPAYQWHHIGLEALVSFNGPEDGFLSRRIEKHNGFRYTIRLREGQEVLDYWEARSRKMIKVSLPPPYTLGYTNSHYWVETWTNALGRDLPLVFRLERYSPT